MLSSHSISPVLDICLGSWLAEAGRSGIRHKSPRHLWCTSPKPRRQREDCSNMITEGTTLKIDLQGVGQGWRQPVPDGALLCCSNIRKPRWSLKVEVQAEGIGAVKGCLTWRNSQEAGQVTAWTSFSSGPLAAARSTRCIWIHWRMEGCRPQRQASQARPGEGGQTWHPEGTWGRASTHVCRLVWALRFLSPQDSIYQPVVQQRKISNKVDG